MTLEEVSWLVLPFLILTVDVGRWAVVLLGEYDDTGWFCTLPLSKPEWAV